jgi:hypothetical protein
MKKLVLILLLLPTLGKAQTTMVWESKINNICYHIELECIPKKSGGVFQFTISDPTIGEEIDYWVTGVWEPKMIVYINVQLLMDNIKKNFLIYS